MDISIVDRWRNVRIAPTKAVTAESDPFKVMSALSMGSVPQNGQVVFECDPEFFATLTAALPNKDYVPADMSDRFEPGMPGQPLTQVPTFLTIPIIVQGE